MGRIAVRKKERASNLIASQKGFFFPALEGHLVVVMGRLPPTPKTETPGWSLKQLSEI